MFYWFFKIAHILNIYFYYPTFHLQKQTHPRKGRHSSYTTEDLCLYSVSSTALIQFHMTYLTLKQNGQNSLPEYPHFCSIYWKE